MSKHKVVEIVEASVGVGIVWCATCGAYRKYERPAYGKVVFTCDWAEPATGVSCEGEEI